MSGWDPALAGVDPERVAEMLVDLRGSGRGRRGSGYRVSASAVLTAAHVVRDAARVRVRFNADRPNEWMTEGTVAWSDLTVDAAVITITPRPKDEAQVAPVSFGRVAERDAVLPCSAMGFPWFKLRTDPDQPLDDGNPSQYRDSVHAVGTIAVLSNRREGTLEVSVTPPERDPDPKRSPWEGMSGAAVWSGARIIGLVAEHHRSDGLGRLAATRIDRWYERLAPDRLNGLCALTGLPARPYDLTDVLPLTAEELLEAGYIAQVRDIAPEQLLGRDKELAELVRFSAGEEHYQWWQADAWAGKSALAAWFVLHPPVGVSVVSFFVTGRLADQADTSAFTEAMVEQLAAVAGEPVAGSATPAGRDRERRRLLEQAARRVGERQRRLLLVVDGLDEDVGARPGSGKGSIASLLPKRPPEAVRVLVTSRPLPGIPGDVPGDHPLRRCVPRPLTPSPFAEDIEVAAKNELTEQLHSGDRLQVDILGLITAAGGGLTVRELGELTEQPEWALAGKLGSVFGRSLKTRASSNPPSADQADRVYLFTHETLRAIAEQQLAHDLGPYRQRIDAWADTYRAQGWPDRTPRYLLRPYGRLLGTSGALDRLVSFATDPARHDRMLAYTYGDAAALAEITRAQELLTGQPVPDLAALGRLAVYRDRLANRNQAIPARLPALWIRLGKSQRAEALARSITSPKFRAGALTAAAEALVEAGQPDHALTLLADAEHTARTITDSHSQVEALTAVAKLLGKAGQSDRAAQTARTITDPDAQGQALSAVAVVLAEAGQPDRAAQTARTITKPDAQAWALTAVATALTKAGQPDRALALAADAAQTARTITDPYSQVKALTAAAKALTKAGQPDHAVTLLADAEHTAYTITHFGRDTALSAVATALAEAGQWNRAEQTAHMIIDSHSQARALTAVAKLLAEAGQWDRAEHTSRSITYPSVQNEALTKVATVLAEAGQWNRAEQAARTIANPYAQVRALTAVATALTKAGQPDRALALAADVEQTARTITDPDAQARLLTAVAEALVEAGQPDQALTLLADAEHTARTITDPDAQAWALTAVATALVEARQPDRALALAADVQQTARTITDPDAQARLLTAVAKLLGKAEQWDHAEQAARTITNSYVQTQAYLAIAADLMVASSRERTRTSELLHGRACKVLAHVLSGERWLEAVQLLGGVDPSGIVAIYEALPSLKADEGPDGASLKKELA